jgi:hypothetical protein
MARATMATDTFDSVQPLSSNATGPGNTPFSNQFPNHINVDGCERPLVFAAPSATITGYRELTSEEKALINTIKDKAEEVGKLCDKLRGLRGMSIADRRWLDIGETDLQKGFMSLVRSVARPTTF